MKKLLLILLFALPLQAQFIREYSSTSSAPANCSKESFWIDRSNNLLSFCNNGAYKTSIGTVASADLTAQAADVGTTTIYTTPSNGQGFYRTYCYIVLTQAASVSSTLPRCILNWTDAETSSSVGAIFTASGLTSNIVGENNINSAGTSADRSGTILVYAKASTAITFSTGSTYASSGSPVMQYSLHIIVQKIQ